ncbi:MAG: hypothetical protein KAU60_14970, partial [Desulfobacterales bacterium]|nr:hypothetical protein [Desulfobacterales bacterium]
RLMNHLLVTHFNRTDYVLQLRTDYLFLTGFLYLVRLRSTVDGDEGDGNPPARIRSLSFIFFFACLAPSRGASACAARA